MRYKNREEIETLLGTDYGKRLYANYERHVVIAFATGKMAFLQPSENIYLNFDIKNILAKRLDTAS